MPMYDVGYRKLKAKLSSVAMRWWMIAESGISVSFRSQWIKRMLLAAWLPILGIGGFIFSFEQALTNRAQISSELSEKFGIDITDAEQVERFLDEADEIYVPKAIRRPPVEPPPGQSPGSQEFTSQDSFTIPERIRHNPDAIAEFLKRRWNRENFGEKLALLQMLTDLKFKEERQAASEELKVLAKKFDIDLDSPDSIDQFVKKASDLKTSMELQREKLAEKGFELLTDPKTGKVLVNLNPSLIAGENLSPQDIDRLNFARQLRRSGGDIDDLPPIFPYRDVMLKAYLNPDDHESRRIGWSFFLTMFLAIPQGIATVILLSLIVPPLISRDLRSRAYFLYFAKPIGWTEYLVGKFAIPAVFLFSITTLPALFLFLFAVVLSPDISVVLDTWDLPIRIVISSLFMIVPTVSIALMLSSLTEESRFATFAWYAIWVLTAGAYFVTLIVNLAVQAQNANGVEDIQPLNSSWQLISLYHSIMNIQAWVFGLVPFDFSVGAGIVLLGLLTLFSWMVMYWRVSAPVRV